MLRNELVKLLDGLLIPSTFKDYCPNGLQVQGSNTVNRIVTGVSLSLELIEYAIASRAQAIIVHHGVFWNKSDYCLTGVKYQRIAKLIKNDINLLAYHLPLDNHPTLGNNYNLAKLLGIEVEGQTGQQNLLWYGSLPVQLSINEFAELYQKKTGHPPIYFGEDDQLIKRIAWCTGGADSMFEEAIALDIDCYLTGEIKEPIMNLSRESGVAFFAGGHYVTERYGIIALSEYLTSLGLNVEFIELYNPI